MKRILVYGMTSNPGGVESVIMNYYRNVNKDNIQFDFLCSGSEIAYFDEIIKLGGSVYFLTPISKNFFKYKKDLFSFFRNNAYKYDAIWVNVCLITTLDYLKYSKKFGIKKRIIHGHNSKNMSSFLRGVFHSINKLFLKKYATDFWCCSDEAGKYFFTSKIINKKNYLVLNNAIDVSKYTFDKNVRDQYRKQLNIENKTVYGNVARLHFQKNHTFLLKVFREIVNHNSDSVLLLVGDGEEKDYLKKLVDYYNLNENVIFLGVRDDINNIMCAMDVLLFPSLFEGLPVVLIEAQTSDLLIFASDTISDSVKIKDNMFFISLNENEIFWSKYIIERLYLIGKRNNDTSMIIKSGYSIKEEAKKLEELF